jgi:hypothetical protein
VYESQCQAFDIASRDSWLKRHVPIFYGACPIEKVFDKDGTNISAQYLLDCCYATELLSGCDVGVPEAILNHPHIAEAATIFNNRGIRTRDASVFDCTDPDNFKIIDIEMER